MTLVYDSYVHLIWISLIIECSLGKYWYNCNKSCDGCLSYTCDKGDGNCTDKSGCKPGWQYIPSEQHKCDIGMLRKLSNIRKKGIWNITFNQVHFVEISEIQFQFLFPF
jgi:hypothetical protein